MVKKRKKKVDFSFFGMGRFFFVEVVNVRFFVGFYFVVKVVLILVVWFEGSFCWFGVWGCFSLWESSFGLVWSFCGCRILVVILDGFVGVEEGGEMCFDL